LRSSLAPEPVDETVVRTGAALRETVLAEYHNKYASAKYRILFHQPPSGVGALWFSDLAECLNHTGVPSATIGYRDPQFREKWEEFQPNVFVSIDSVEMLRSLDLSYIADYKRRRGCLRLFTPVVNQRFPLPGLSSEDRLRLQLAVAGRSADAFFSMMEPEFFETFFREWQLCGFRYFSIPNGANPFKHFPVAGTKDLDYFVVTGSAPVRVRVARRYLTPVLKNYYGVWAGTSWGFGCGPLPASRLKEFYARARIAPAPLLDVLCRFPCEVTERAFSGPACGGFLITNATPVSQRFFDGNELIQVKNSGEFMDMFTYYLRHPEERNATVLRAMRRVFAEHTYFHRIDILMTTLSKIQGLS
jgi:hypothetical protein